MYQETEISCLFEGGHAEVAIACTYITVIFVTKHSFKFFPPLFCRKMQLSRSEMYVQKFVDNMNMGKNVKVAAANTIKHQWLIHKYKKYGKYFLVRR